MNNLEDYSGYDRLIWHLLNLFNKIYYEHGCKLKSVECGKYKLGKKNTLNPYTFRNMLDSNFRYSKIKIKLKS